MNISRSKLNEYITLYLNDVLDYHEDDAHYPLAESVLSPIAKLTLESDQNINELLKEKLSNASPEHKDIIKDFLSYIKEI